MATAGSAPLPDRTLLGVRAVRTEARCRPVRFAPPPFSGAGPVGFREPRVAPRMPAKGIQGGSRLGLRGRANSAPVMSATVLVDPCRITAHLGPAARNLTPTLWLLTTIAA